MRRLIPETGRWTPVMWTERGIGIVAFAIAITGPLFLNGNWTHNILTETFFFGIAASSLIFLSAYGGMVSLAQVAMFGIAGFVLGNLSTQGGPGGTSKGLHLGWDPTLAIVFAVVITTVVGLAFGFVAARSAGIYFLMITLTYTVIAFLFFQNVTNVSGFSGIGGVNQYTPGWLGNVLDHPNRLYYLSLGVAIAVYVLIRYLIRTPFGITLQGVRDEPIRMASLGYNVALHRALAFAFAGFVASLAGILYTWWSGQIAPDSLGLEAAINLLIIAVIGGLGRIEGAWLGAFTFIVIQNYVRDFNFPGLSFGGTLFGGSFNTLIGIIFLAIVLVSPDGLIGIWTRLFDAGLRGSRWRRHPEPPAAETA